MPPYKTALFIFRRDLRVDDNTGLLSALNNARTVIPCFIFDPEQIKPHPYRSDSGLYFLVESLRDLESQLKARGGTLHICLGKPKEVVDSLIKKFNVEAVYLNRDYTPFSINRDLAIEYACKKQGVFFHSLSDALLNEPEDIKKKDGGVYTVFTPFFNKALDLPVLEPQKNRLKNYFNGKILSLPDPIYKNVLSDSALKPLKRGRKKSGVRHSF